MTVYIDKKFVNFLGASLDRFAWKKDNLANCRCPLCGDSQKNKSKARGYFFEKDGSYFYKCHNCAASHSLYTFLELVNPTLKSEYQLERYRTKQSPKPKPVSIKSTGVEKVFGKKKPKENNKSKFLKPMRDLPSDHPARVFVKHRRIPKDKYDLLYFTEDFGSYIKELTGVLILSPEARLVLPFFDKDGHVVAAQGRTLNMGSASGSADRETDSSRKTLRYMTIKSPDAPEKLWFGQWRVNPKKKIYIVEGPIDSLFLDNCIAMVGASGLNNIPEHLKDSEGVYILDNEPRNKQIVKLMERLIDSGRKICIWPRTIALKDINDMVIAGMTKSEIKKIIDDNTFEGLEAKYRLSHWSKS
jgi:Zn-finger protein